MQAHPQGYGNTAYPPGAGTWLTPFPLQVSTGPPLWDPKNFQLKGELVNLNLARPAMSCSFIKQPPTFTLK